MSLSAGNQVQGLADARQACYPSYIPSIGVILKSLFSSCFHFRLRGGLRTGVMGWSLSHCSFMRTASGIKCYKMLEYSENRMTTRQQCVTTKIFLRIIANLLSFLIHQDSEQEAPP